MMRSESKIVIVPRGTTDTAFRSDRRRMKLRQYGACRDSAPASHGVVSVKGRRREMEDAVRAQVGFAFVGGGGGGGERRLDFYGVYDGHGGGCVAGACRERLHVLVAAAIAEEAGHGEVCWERVMEGCFSKMEEELRRNAAARTVGATAVAAVVSEDTVVVVNCGDCRAVLATDGVAVPLSEDHKPDRPDELERIEAAGGRVVEWNGFRVLGVLATSRSLGDQYLRPFVISKPEVTVTKRTQRDEFLILASDGLWDVLSNEFTCRVVRKCLQGKLKRRFSEYVDATDCENRASEAATLLTELAIARGSRDNISVIVVELRKP